MSAELFSVIDQRCVPKRRDFLRGLLIVGGCRDALIQNIDIWKPDFVVRADVPFEFEQLPIPDYVRVPVFQFALAPGQTLDTLYATASPVIRAAIRRLPGISSYSGLNQIPDVGRQAANLLTQTADFQEFLDLLTGHVRYAARCRLLGVALISKGSMVGATSAGATLILNDAIVNALSRLSIPIKVVLDETGHATFAKIDRRGALNVAVSLPRFLLETLRRRKNAGLLVTTRLHLVELPPTYKDQVARRRYVLADEQAQAASELQTETARDDPNSAIGLQTGGVTVREVDFGLHLDEKTEVNPPIAKLYLFKIREALEQAQACRSLVQEINPEPRATPTLRESPADVAARASQTEIAELIAAMRQPSQRVHYSLTLLMAGGDREYQMDHFAMYFAEPAASLTESAARLRILRSQLAVLGDELTGATEQEAKLSASLRDVETQLRATHPQLQTGPPNKGWLGFGRKKETTDADIEEIVASGQQLADQREDAASLKRALQLAHVAVAAEERSLSNELDGLVKVLNRDHLLRGLSEEPPAMVLARPIDEAYEELRNLPQLPLEQQRRRLARQAEVVTLEGLARITGAPVPRVEAIVDRLLAANWPEMGPPWAGQIRQDTPHVVIVLPAMLAEQAEPIRKAIALRNDRVQVVFTDSIRAVVNTVRYRFYRVQAVAELYPENLQQALLAGREGELAPLYDIDNDPALRQAGIIVEGDRVRFTNEISLD